MIYDQPLDVNCWVLAFFFTPLRINRSCDKQVSSDRKSCGQEPVVRSGSPYTIFTSTKHTYVSPVIIINFGLPAATSASYATFITSLYYLLLIIIITTNYILCVGRSLQKWKGCFKDIWGLPFNKVLYLTTNEKKVGSM